MADLTCRDLQEAVGRCLARHRSVLDVMSKLEESVSRTNRAVAKSVTSCGCIEIRASKQHYPQEASFSELADHVSSHLEGRLCDCCREVIESEMGRQILYMAALCEVLGLDLAGILECERDRLAALGSFYFS